MFREGGDTSWIERSTFSPDELERSSKRSERQAGSIYSHAPTYPGRRTEIRYANEKQNVGANLNETWIILWRGGIRFRHSPNWHHKSGVSAKYEDRVNVIRFQNEWALCSNGLWLPTRNELGILMAPIQPPENHGRG
jgi:hypothetical protein